MPVYERVWLRCSIVNAALQNRYPGKNGGWQNRYLPSPHPGVYRLTPMGGIQYQSIELMLSHKIVPHLSTVLISDVSLTICREYQYA